MEAEKGAVTVGRTSPSGMDVDKDIARAKKRVEMTINFVMVGFVYSDDWSI